MVNGGLVLYSCGDFIDDYKVSPEYDSNIGLLANILFRDSNITDIQLLATRVDSVMESNRYYHQVNMGNWKDLNTIEARTKM